MVTVNFAKAKQITHDFRANYFLRATQEHFAELMRTELRIKFMVDGDEKTFLEGYAAGIYSLIEEYIAIDAALTTTIDGVTSGDIAGLVEIYQGIEKDIQELNE